MRQEDAHTRALGCLGLFLAPDKSKKWSAGRVQCNSEIRYMVQEAITSVNTHLSSKPKNPNEQEEVP